MSIIPGQMVVAADSPVDAIVGTSTRAHEMRTQIHEISRYSLGVLISGPRGAEKNGSLERFARAATAATSCSFLSTAEPHSAN